MSDPQPQVDSPQSDSSAERTPMTGGAGPLPAWNRERLIEQFQQIDGSTRSEAERQIAAFEQTFRTPIAAPTGTGPPPAGSHK